MKRFVSTLVPVMALYMWLTAGSGDVFGLWAASELVLGAVLSVITAWLTALHVGSAGVTLPVNPLRWILFALYLIGPFLLEMAKANLDVAYRVITGRINPGIVRVNSGMKTAGSTTALANSITLTPGTLTVGVDEETNDLFIHKINLTEEEAARSAWDSRDLFGFNLPAMIRRFSE